MSTEDVLCRKCGTRIEVDLVKFCTKCGAENTDFDPILFEESTDESFEHAKKDECAEGHPVWGVPRDVEDIDDDPCIFCPYCGEKLR